MTAVRWWRATGDRLPSFATTITYDDGVTPVDLTGSPAPKCYLDIANAVGVQLPLGVVLPNGWVEVPLAIANPAAAIVFYDWQLPDVIPPGVYRLAVRVVFPDGTEITAGTDGRAQLVVW
jgi:hypothetical protein